MKAYIDPEVCSGSGLCINTCAEVFELTDEGISTVAMDPIPPEYEQACREASENCPTNAISIKE